MDGGVPVQLTNQLSRSPAVSPDGKSIAYTYFDPKANPRQRLAIMPFDGEAPTKVVGIDGDNPNLLVRWCPMDALFFMFEAIPGISGVNRFQGGHRSDNSF